MQSSEKPYIFYTSGTTGEPKVVKKTYANLEAEALDMADFFKVSKDMVIVSTVNPEHMFGAVFTVMLAKVTGCRLEPEKVFFPEDLKDYGKYIFVTSPSFLAKLAKYDFKFKYKPQMIIAAGANLDDEVFAYFENICPVTDIYGSTETGTVAYRQSHKDHLKVFDNVKMEIGDGKVVVKSPYFSEPEIVLNDNLEFFKDGFLVKGRNDRIVKIYEKRILLDSVEKNLNSNELVEKSHCLKIDNKLCAAVVLNEKGRKLLLEKGKFAVIKLLNNNAHADVTGSSIHCKRWRFLFELPLTNSGKINGARVREIFNTNVTYPYVLDYSIQSFSAQFNLVFAHNSNFFKGHFTDFPILPGVVQLFFAKEFVKDTFNLDFIPEKVKKVKFSSIIKPDTLVHLSLVRKENSVDFKFFDKDKVFSSGTFVL